MKVPPLDLKAQFQTIRDDALARIDSVFDSQHFILGPMVEELESRMAALCGAKHAVGVASGSDALLLSLMALGVQNGDKVVTTPFSFFSTVSSITRVGARPHFVDIDPDTFNLDPDLLAEVHPVGVKAVLPVHLYGQLAHMEDITSWAAASDVAIVEDAAQAVGASRNGRISGSWGELGAFSFYPTKNLGGAGDGGMIVTSDDRLAERLRCLRDHGARRRYFHSEIGINSRLDALQAAVLLAKLPHLGSWNAERKAIAGQYREALAGLPLKLPTELPGNDHTYHQFVIRTERRDELKTFLDSEGIYTAIFYPVPLHLQECFGFLGYEAGDFPEAERAAREVLALPIYPELGRDRFEVVVKAIKKFFQD